MVPRLRHVFFDVTDTLLRIRGSVGAVYTLVAARHAFETTPAQIDASFQRAIRSAPPPAFPGASHLVLPDLEREWWRAVVRDTFAPIGSFPHFEDFFEEVFELFRTSEPWELLPGARETLETLQRQNRELGVISDMDSRLHDVLRALDLDHLLRVVVLSPAAGWAKPDPRLFKLALERARATPQSAVHVGDSLRSDIQGAQSAGMTAIYVDSHGRHDAPHGVPSVRILSELPDLLTRLDPLEPLGPLDPLNRLDPLDPLDPFDPLNRLDREPK